MTFSRSDLKLLMGALTGIGLGNFTIFSAPLYIGGLMDGLGFDEAQAGLIITLEIGAVASIAVLLSGWLGRAKLRYLATVGAVIILLANLVTFSLESYPAIIVTRTLAGAGAGLCLAASSALLSRMADPDRAMGILMVCNTLIMILALTAMGYAKSQWMFGGFVAPFTLVALLFLPLILLIPAKPFSAGTKTGNNSPTVDHHRALGGLGMGLLFVFCVIEGSIWAFSERAAFDLDIDEGDIGLLLALAQIGGLAGGAFAAVFGQRISRILPIGAGTSLMGIAGLMIYQTDSQAIFSVCLIGFSFGFFVAFPYLIGAFARLDADGRWVARASGLNLFGSAFAPFVAGNIIVASNYQSLGRFCFGLAIVCLILALLFNRQMNRTNLTVVTTLSGARQDTERAAQ